MGKRKLTAKKTPAKKKKTTKRPKPTSKKIKPLTGKFSDFSGIVLKAAAAGKLTAVKHYLAINSDWLNEVGPHGRTMLWEAAYKGRTELVAELIAMGADVSPYGSYYTPMLVELTPLAVARLAGREELAKLLIANGAKDDFYSATHRGDLTAMKKYISRSRKVVNKPLREEPEPIRMGWHPVHYAVAGQQLDALKLLVAKGAKVADHYELLVDWGENHRQIVKFVKNQTKAEDPNRSTKKKKAVPRLPMIDQPNQWGFPALVEACRGNHNATDDPQRVQELLNQKANINIRDYKGKTGLHRAAQAGFTKITSLLLKHKADTEAEDNKQGTPIFDAAFYGRHDVLKILLKGGANREHVNYRGDTALVCSRTRQAA